MKMPNVRKIAAETLRPISRLSAAHSLSGSQDRRSIRSAYRIAAIDDDVFPHKSRLRELGFQIDYFSKLEEIDRELHYGLYVCDIMGVEADTVEDGVWTMREIKLRAPVSPLLGYTYLSPVNAKYQSARNICDAIVRKSDEIDELVRNLDDLIIEINNPVDLWRRIRGYLLLQGIETRHVAVLEHYFVTAVLKRSPERFGEKAQRFLVDEGLSAVIVDAIPLVAKSIGSKLIKSSLGLSPH